MSIATKYVGLDVSKSKIAVAIADEGRAEPRYWGTIVHTKEAVCKLMQVLRKSEEVTLEVCYEAGPTGYVLYRWLLEMDVSCTIVAPSLIPKRAGDRVKTDKRDALRLAQLFRAGELVSVYIPTPADEALRDLVRAREDAKEDLNRHKQRLGKFLLRYQLADPKRSTPWTFAYEAWLDSLTFSHDCQRMAFQEYRQTIRETKERIKTLRSGNRPTSPDERASAADSSVASIARCGSAHRNHDGFGDDPRIAFSDSLCVHELLRTGAQ